MTSTLGLVPTKSVDEKVANSVKKFLRTFALKYASDANRANGINGAEVAIKLKVTQGYVSELLKPDGQRKPGLALVIRLRQLTGASFEEITGHRAPLSPKYPLRLLAPDNAAAEVAAGETAEHDRSSGTFRGPEAAPVKPTRR